MVAYNFQISYKTKKLKKQKEKSKVSRKVILKLLMPKKSYYQQMIEIVPKKNKQTKICIGIALNHI